MALVYSGMIDFAPHFYFVSYTTWGSAVVWLQIILIPTTCIGVDMVGDLIRRMYFPTTVIAGIEENRLWGVDCVE